MGTITKINVRKSKPIVFLCLIVYIGLLFVHFNERFPPLESEELLVVLFLFILALGHAAEVREIIVIEPGFVRIEGRGSEVVIMRSEIKSVQREGKTLRVEGCGGRLLWTSSLFSRRQTVRFIKELGEDEKLTGQKEEGE